MYISEIFGPTIQGEGLYCGKVSIFIRFAKCNMQCRGFGVEYIVDGVKRVGCDSFHAVDTSFENEWQKVSNVKELIDKITILEKGLNYKPHIVITGGEPLIYWNKNIFQDFINYYLAKKYKLTIETNGSIKIKYFNKLQKKIVFSISLKLSSSLELEKIRLRYKNIKKLLVFKKSYLKFVISSLEDEIEILKIINKLDIASSRVFLMPNGSTQTDIHKNSVKTINLCTKHGFRYTDRIHIRVWNNKKGV
jgi:organic radical activating enzyme